jgi:hypothetical protein
MYKRGLVQVVSAPSKFLSFFVNRYVLIDIIATRDDVNEDVAMDVTNDEDNGIECQCCFADYPFVRTSLLSPFYLTSRPTVQNGSMSQSSPLLINLHLKLRITQLGLF